MKRLVLLLLVLSVPSVAAGAVWTTVYGPDCTPIDPNARPYPDIMVGTKLKIIVSSDANESDWLCDLGIKGTDRECGVLSNARLLECAAEDALLLPWHDPSLEIDGFTFSGGGTACDWFSVDYTAIAVGDCNVGYYEWFSDDPNDNLSFSFSNVLTRDFNNDTRADFLDFAVLAAYWRETGCEDLKQCEGADLNADGLVDGKDLGLFVDFWLESTERCK